MKRGIQLVSLASSLSKLKILSCFKMAVDQAERLHTYYPEIKTSSVIGLVVVSNEGKVVGVNLFLRRSQTMLQPKLNYWKRNSRLISVVCYSSKCKSCSLSNIAYVIQKRILESFHEYNAFHNGDLFVLLR